VKLAFRCAMALLIAVLATGCSSFQHKKQMNSFNDAYTIGDFDNALLAVSFKTAKGKAVDSEAHLLDLLHQGELYRMAGRYQEAADTYDLAEEGMKYLDTESLVEQSAEGFMAVMVNDSERDYEALMSEAILVNTYKALSFLAVANNEYARIEFKRADDRTRRAVEFFGKEIAEQREALEEEAQNQQSNAALVSDSLSNNQLQAAVEQNYGAAEQWSVLSEFMVPASTYMNGLYFLANASSNSDFEQAANSLKRVAAMKDDSLVLQKDAELAMALASGEQSVTELAPQVWVVYENGLGPVLEETRFDVPLLLFHGNQQAPAYFGIALPKYSDRTFIPGGLSLSSSTGETVETERISDMGSVIRTEMKARFPGVLARAVSSAVIKAIIQNEASENFGVWGQLGAAALTIATTQADLRGWQALPNHWQAARIDRPEDGQLLLSDAAGNALGTLAIPEQPFTLVYVKRPTATSPASVVALDLQGSNPAFVEQLPKPAQLTAAP
jgi:hypothetical protein